MTDVDVITYGRGHGAPPEAHLTVDLQSHFRDPHKLNDRLRGMTAYDEEIRAIVLATPGIWPLIDASVSAVLAFLAGPSAGPLAVAVGCRGGRHRAATFGMVLAQRLTECGLDVDLVHRDLDKGLIAH